MAQEKLIDAPLQTVTRKMVAAVTTAPVPVMATTNENECKVVDALNAVIEGILQQNCAAGELVPVVVAGIVPVRVDAAVSRGAMMMTSSTGTSFTCPKTSGTTYNLFGIAKTKATAAGEFVSVQLVPSTLRVKT